MKSKNDNTIEHKSVLVELGRKGNSVQALEGILSHLNILTNKSVYYQNKLSNTSTAIRPPPIIIFIHGSGSGKESPRNKQLSDHLNKVGFSTLLIDLLTSEEKKSDLVLEREVHTIPGLLLNKFNIDLLTQRVMMILKWVDNYYYCLNKDLDKSNPIRIGLFGASTGVNAILQFLSNVYKEVNKPPYDLLNLDSLVVVCRGGRVDLVDFDLSGIKIKAALFIVGKKDLKKIVEGNSKLVNKLSKVEHKDSIIINGASHLFEESGKIEEVAVIATDWFIKYFN